MAVPVHPPGTEHDAFPPILVNVGDLLSYWTGGLLKSTVHRVVFPGGVEGGKGEGEGEAKVPDRYSVAYFCHPWRETKLVPVPSEMVRMKVEAEGGSSGDGGVERGKGADGGGAFEWEVGGYVWVGNGGREWEGLIDLDEICVIGFLGGRVFER